MILRKHRFKLWILIVRFYVYKHYSSDRSFIQQLQNSSSSLNIRSAYRKLSVIMPSTRRHSYDLNFKLKIVAEAEAVSNNREIAREYGISESMVRKWRNQQHVLFSGELKMTAKRASMGRYRPKDPEVDQQLADWFTDQRSQGKNCSLKMTLITTQFTLPLQKLLAFQC